MKKCLFLILLIPILGYAQTKKVLDHSAYDEWRGIESRLISNDGKYVAYTVTPNSIGNEDAVLMKIDGTVILSHGRASQLRFTNNSQYLIFKISPDFDTVQDLKRNKTKEKDMPKDSLAIYQIATGQMTKIAGLRSFKVPEKWDDHLIYLYEPAKDTTAATKKHKKRDKKNGYDLMVSNLKDGSSAIFNYVIEYQIAEEGAGLALVTTGNDSTIRKGVYRYDFVKKSFAPIYRSKGEFHQLNWDKLGKSLSFISDTDTTKALLRDYKLNLWQTGADSSKTLMSNKDLKDLNVNHEYGVNFSKTGKRLFFQVKSFPILQDTMLLEDEIVKVEVWSHTDEKLHTQQKIDKKDDAKFGYLSMYDLATGKITRLGSPQFNEVEVSDEGDGTTIIATNEVPYQHLIQWEGGPTNRDLYSIDVLTGKSKLVEKRIRGNVRLSPKGKYAYWYDVEDSIWFAYSFAESTIKKITANDKVRYYDELNDSPDYPSPYGVMSWTENDEKVLIYDRYDIWEVDPKGIAPRKRITPDGRSQNQVYRYIKLDNEERFIKNGQSLLLKGFYESNKQEALYSFTYGKNVSSKLLGGDYTYGNFRKAKGANNLIFTQENFTTFPDLQSSDLSFKNPKKISDINPQQKDYNWGTSELVYWTSLDGEKLEGMLIKPENFDPTNKYPLLVNFYERSSDGLNDHRAPGPGRSSINYSFYASRGYIIFNPNIHYKIGYPGESAYNCVIPGVTELISKGFIDEENIAAQGHSWGGYQIAYLIGKTNIFKCVEAGAPVPNMISAYGGIRWWTGLSRMFQYEHTQSRIGGTLWEYPMRYIENSPIFYIDKVNTPVLIMANDADGHVPWYQGIEYFSALKRLNKTSWMLNYQGEPHWPVKLQNRVDFNIRLAQYFDYYLKGAPMPKWMRDGVPPMEMGIRQGYELLNKE